MNSIQNYGINNFQLKNNAIMFRANTKPIGEALQKTANKSGIYQVYVDKLAELQKEIEYGCYLLRQIPHNWCNPKSASDANRDICIQYHKNVDKLKNEKKKIIAEMVDSLLKKEKYKDLPKGYRERIINDEEAGSTWQGYYFNEKQLDKRIANMKARDKKIPINAEVYEQKRTKMKDMLEELYNKKQNDSKQGALSFGDFADFWSEYQKLHYELGNLDGKVKKDHEKIDKLVNEVEKLLKKYNS